MKFDMTTNEISVQHFTDVLFSDEVKDLGVELSEIALDSFGDNISFLDDIPLLRVFAVAGKTVKNIQAWCEWKNQLAFLVQLKKGTVNAEKIEKRTNAYKNKEKWIRREIEALVVYLSKYTTVEKARIQGELYIDLVNGVITQEQFCECLDVLFHLFLSDVPHLLEIYQAEKDAGLTKADLTHFSDKITTKFNPTICRRLMAVGLLHQLHPMSFGFTMDNHFVTSDTGKYFCEIIQRCK